MNRANFTGLFALSTLAVGCATNTIYGELRTDPGCRDQFVDERRLERELGQATPCCESFSEMPLSSLKADAATPHGITKLSPIFDFPSGKSRFVAFDLGQSKGRFFVVRPEVSGRTAVVDDCKDFKFAALVGEGSAWYRALEPVATFLDKERKPIATSVPAISPRTGDFRIPIPAGAQFAIIHTLPSDHGIRRRLYTSMNEANVVVPGMVGVMTLRGPNNLAAVITATGWFTVEFRDD
jgi:hypothetical protein